MGVTSRFIFVLVPSSVFLTERSYSNDIVLVKA